MCPFFRIAILIYFLVVIQLGMLVRESLVVFLAILVVGVTIALLAFVSHTVLISKGANPFDIARNGLPVTLPWL